MAWGFDKLFAEMKVKDAPSLRAEMRDYLVFVECREIVYAFIFHRTWFGEAIGDVARYVSVLKSLFQ